MKKLLIILSTITMTSGTVFSNSNIISNAIINQKNSSNNIKMNTESHIKTWKLANPYRTKTIKEKTQELNNTIFAPYIDGGLVSNNDVGDVQKFIPNFQSITLAFIQQAVDVKDQLHLTMAGIPSGSTEWTDDGLARNVYKPLAKKGQLKNMIVSYGGANGSKYTNPWSVALSLCKGDQAKAMPMLEQAFIDYSKHISSLAGVKGYYPQNLDFDIEGGALVSDVSDIQFLINTLVDMLKKDSNWHFTFTLPVLPTGLTPDGEKVLNMYVKAWSDAKLDMNTLPETNLMTMDYGDSFYQQKKTDFTFAKDAVNNTKEQLQNAVYLAYGKQTDDKFLYPKLGATPMIGINDVKAGVFTLDDAKELYNWAHENNLGSIRMWSFNDDAPVDENGNINKSVTSHGLNYLQNYDFAKAFSGEWDHLVIDPLTSPDNHDKPIVKKDITSVINTTYLGNIDEASSDVILNDINKYNNTDFTYKDIQVTQLTPYGAKLVGRGNWEGSMYISFTVRHNLATWTNNEQGDKLMLGTIANNETATIQNAINNLVTGKIDPSLSWIDWNYLTLTQITFEAGKYKYLLKAKDASKNNPFRNSVKVTFKTTN